MKRVTANTTLSLLLSSRIVSSLRDRIQAGRLPRTRNGCRPNALLADEFGTSRMTDPCGHGRAGAHGPRGAL